MRHFERGQSPMYLQDAARHCPNWDAFARMHEHGLAGDELYEKQHHYCAYCEIHMEHKSDGHIEHLARRSDFPQSTFDWNNMFFSCNHKDSCGNYKDNHRIKFDFRDIVDPSKENPQDFFAFDRFGHVFPKADLPEMEKRRASETIRVFNLDGTERLLGLRRQAVQAVAAFLQCDAHPDTTVIDQFLEMVGDADCISVYYTLLDRRMP